jgi:outer membrane protein TolC
VSPEESIAALAGLPAAVEFRAVGPEGGPLDEPDAVQGELTLPDAVRRAVTTDPGLQAALARVWVAMAEADEARLLPNPVLNVVFRAGEGRPSIEASLVQEFVQVLERPTRACAADDRLRAVAADSVVTALDVIGTVHEVYIAAQASTALLPLLEERLALVERHVATARARLDVGEGTRADVVTLDAQRVELEVSIDRARLDERTHRLRLARLIGEPSSAAAWTLDAWSAPPLRASSALAWVEAALESRPELQALVWRMRALGDDETLAGYGPWEGASAGIDAERDDGWQLGPTIVAPLPIFDSGATRRAGISAQQLAARHEWTLAKRRVVEEVRTAHEALNASAANLARIERELLPLQQERRQLAEDAYSAGQTDVTPLFLAEQDLRVAQTQAVEVESQAAVALVRLQRAVGGPGVADRIEAARLEADRAESGPLAVDSPAPTFPRER